MGAEQRRADAQRRAARPQKIRGIGQIHAPGRHEAQVREGRAQGFHVIWAQTIRGKNLDKIRARLVGRLRLRRSISPEHRRTIGGQGGGRDFRTHDGADDKLRARLDGLAADDRIQNRSHADYRARPKFPAGRADGGERAGGGHGDFNRGNAAGDQGLSQRQNLLLTRQPHHDDNPRIEQL